MEIIKEPDPRLRAVAEPVEEITAEVGGIIDEIVFTMKDADGVGLAAPQVGVGLRIIAVHVDPDADGVFQTFAMVNPEILTFGGNALWGDEGCLSVPGVVAKRQRASEVEVRCLDRAGTEVTFTAKGHAARVIQHEIDHPNGITILKAISPAKRKQYLRRQKKRR